MAEQIMPWEEYQSAPATGGQGVVIPKAEPAPKEAPSGFEDVGGQLQVIKGGPADPEVIAAQAAARKGGEGASATELDLKAKEEGAQKRASTIRAIMGRVEDLYQSDIAGQPAERLGGLTEYISSLPKNDRFNAASNAMLPLIRPLVAQSAKEGDSDKEMQVFMAYIPQASDSDIAIEEKLNMLKTLIGGMVDGKPPSTVQTEVYQAMEQSKGGPFQYGDTVYQAGPSGNQPPPDGGTPEGPSMLDQIGQGLSYGLGDIAEAGGDILGLVGNPLNATINAAMGTNLSTDLGRTTREALGLPANPNAMASAINQGGAAALTGSLLSRGGAQLASGMARSGLEAMGSTPIADVAGGVGSGAASQIAASQGAGAGGQIAASLLGGVAGAKASGARLPAAMSAQDQALISAAKREQVPLMTTDVAPPETFVGKSAQFTGERIPFAGTAGKRVEQQQARTDAAKRIVQDYGGADPALLDKVSEGLLASRGAALTKYSTAKKEVIDGLAGAGEIPVDNATKAIDEQIAELTRRGTDPALKVADYLTRLRGDIQGKSLDQIEAIRQDELSQAFGPNSSLAEFKSVGEKAVRKIYGPLNEDMGAFIKSAGDRRDFNKWMVSNKRLSEMAGELKITSLKNALRKADVAPETVASALFSSKPSEVRALYSNLSEQGKANARAAILARAAEKAGGLEDISPDRFANEVARLGSSVGVAFTGAEKARIDGLMRVLKSTKRAGQANVATATGQQTYIPSALAAAGDLFATGGALLAGAATLGLSARAFESPAVRDLMVRLGKTKPGSKDEAFLVKRVTSALMAADKEEGQ